jgi:ligand-binding sensor domain-containing protein
VGVSHLHRLRDGRLWAATVEGLCELDGDRFRAYTTLHGLASNSIIRLGEDRAGNLWFHALVSGVMKLTAEGFTTYGLEDGLGAEPGKKARSRIRVPQVVSPARVHSVQEDGEGRLLTVSGIWIVSRFDGTRFEAVSAPMPPDPEVSWGAQVGFLDSHGDWWFTSTRGLYRTSRGSGEGRAPSSLRTGSRRAASRIS